MTHNVCGVTVTEVTANDPGGKPIGSFLFCPQCKTVITIGEVSTPEVIVVPSPAPVVVPVVPETPGA